MSGLRRPAAAALLLIVSACSTIEIDTDYDTTADFSGFRTWAWRADANQGAPSSATRNSLVDRRVRPAVERHLAARGFEHVDTGEPDFRVAYQVGVQGKLYITTWDDGGFRRRGWGGTTTTQVSQYQEGALVLAILEGAGGRVVWQGTARAIVDPSDSPEDREARIDEAVGRILEHFPPGVPSPAAE